MQSRGKEITAPHLWTVLTRSHRAVEKLAEGSIARTGLCLTDFAALEALLHKGPLTITELQGKVLLASGSMTAAVDRLEKRGLLLRKPSPADRRARVLELTQQGRRLAQSCFQRHAHDLEALMAALSRNQRAALCSSLRKIGLRASNIIEQQP
ncbi:MAG: MarR family transcriptional regulator [Acidobacteria bacterium]|nr:MarR family transcriptional regulator [Acidobacteriota bacterium]